MALPNWWQVTTPHRDIIEGRFDESIFAADLGNVILGKAPVEYMDGAMFFQKTYVTKGLEELLTAIWKRLSGSSKGQPVIQLQTPFGGGKTHSLLALYHLFSGKADLSHTDVIQKLQKSIGITVPKVKVAAFVGTHADALGGRTPWGEIAHQLGCYEIVKEHDEKRIAPGKERLIEILEKAGTCLILIDELLEYVVKKNRAEKVDKITEGQTAAFLQELTEAVSTTGNSALVVTLPASILEQYDTSAEKALSRLQKVSGRIESIYTPVEGVEIYEVIRKRLFENLGDEKVHKEVAQWHFSLYHELRDDVLSEVRSTEYRDKIERAYPFHPELIDILYERWGSFPTFQRTRGVLRLLAEVIGELYNQRVSAPLVQSSMIPLHRATVRREFLKHIGNEFDAVIAADIGEKGSKAPEIDRHMSSEYAKEKIATGIATAVFIYSFSGGPRKGLNIRELRVATLREGIPRTIIGDTVSKLVEELWYFHSTGGIYAFKNQANLNRVIVDSEDHIKENDIQSELKDLLKKYAGNDLETYLWPHNSADIPDSRKVKLIVLSPDQFHPQNKCEEFTSELFTHAGTGYRTYKNGILILAMDENAGMVLKSNIKRHLALKHIQGDEGLKSTITKNDMAELSRKITEAKSLIMNQLFIAYRYLAHLTNGNHRWIDMGIITTGSFTTLSGRVKEYLVDQELLLTKISPQVVVKKTQLGDEDEKQVSDIYEMFLRVPGMPLLLNPETLYGAIRNGVSSGVFGLKSDSQVWFNQTIFDVNGDMTLIGKKAVSKLISSEEETKETEQFQHISDQPSEVKEPVGDEQKTEQRLPHNLTIDATVPWDKLSSLVSGVIAPLKNRNADLKIHINLKAHSDQGFDRITLDSRVKETLQQIGAQLEIWQED